MNSTEALEILKLFFKHESIEIFSIISLILSWVVVFLTRGKKTAVVFAILITITALTALIASAFYSAQFT